MSCGQGNASFTRINSNRALFIWSLNTENIFDELTFVISKNNELKNLTEAHRWAHL